MSTYSWALGVMMGISACASAAPAPLAGIGAGGQMDAAVHPGAGTRADAVAGRAASATATAAVSGVAGHTSLPQGQAGMGGVQGAAGQVSRAGAGATLQGPAGQGGAQPRAGAPASASGAGSQPSAADGGAGGAGGAAAGHAAASGGSPAALTPVYRVPLRVHMQASQLTDAQLTPIFDELNRIWLEQAGICFEIEVTRSEDNRSDGFDFRYTSGRIPGASNANGLTESAHAIWSIDHPQLNNAPHPVMNPTARTTAHELGHALGLAHENPPPSSDCSQPCYCAQRADNCDDYLLRSGTKGFFLSPPEVEIARQHGAKVGLADHTPESCGAAKSN